MTRKLSLYALLATVAAFAVFFIQIIRPFLLAVFFAVVLAVLFNPPHDYLTRRLGGRRRISAGLTVLAVVLLLLVPISGVLLLAGSQLLEIGQEAVRWLEPAESPEINERWELLQDSRIGRELSDFYLSLPDGQRTELREMASRFSDGITTDIADKTRGMLRDAFGFALRLAVMTLAFYYFLADGPQFMKQLHDLLPLKDAEEAVLSDRFENVCRGVVLGTLAAGLAQATLAGIGFAVAGVEGLWMLIVLTMLCSFIPFLGAAVVWGGVAIYLFFDGRPVAAFLLAGYGAGIVSTSDNIVRAYVIGSQAKLHPLVALISVLGAIRLVGLWGIFLGPMLAAFLVALVEIVRRRLETDGKVSAETEPLRTE